MSETHEVGRQQTQQSIEISVLLTPTDTAALLHTTVGVLAVWRSCRRYPLAFVRVGRKIMYRQEDVQHFIESRTQSGVVELHDSNSRRGRSRGNRRAKVA
jgi:hypothetical protein